MQVGNFLFLINKKLFLVDVAATISQYLQFINIPAENVGKVAYNTNNPYKLFIN